MTADDSDTYEALLEELAAELTALRVRAGNPSLRDIERRAHRLFIGEGVSLPPSTLSGLFNGGYPGRDRLLWLVRTLMSWDRAGQDCLPPANGARELDPWHDRWEAITQVKPSRQRRQPRPAAPVAESAPGTTPLLPQTAGPRAGEELPGPPQVTRPPKSSTWRKRMRRSVVFVPGFGLGEPAYERTFAMVHAGLAERRPDVAVHGCYWGQEAGTRPFFNGLSIPGDGPSGYGRTGDEDGAAWSRLYQDPKHELRALGLRLSASTESGRGRKPAQKLLAELSGYVASSWVRSAFKEHGLEGALDSALQAIIESPELRNAVMAAGEDGYEHRQTFARAVVAAALTEAEGPQAPALRDPQRDTLVSLVSIDLLAQSRTLEERGDTVAVSPFLFPLLKRSWRRRGEHINVLLGSGVGDLLRYQARGDAQRRLIKKIVEDTPGDAITVIAYSFGSVACVDLMVREEVGRVDQLITVGSQVPFFYEIGALSSLEPPEVLPEHFPQQWLNIYDRRDLLSFAAAQVFPRIATDLEVDSGQPFPQAHSAYWMNSSLWTAVGMWLS